MESSAISVEEFSGGIGYYEEQVTKKPTGFFQLAFCIFRKGIISFCNGCRTCQLYLQYQQVSSYQYRMGEKC